MFERMMSESEDPDLKKSEKLSDFRTQIPAVISG